ncbi:hypothetical protein [Sporosarcina ureae]|nr:hypothetical protein [Sporosarcina ureae]
MAQGLPIYLNGLRESRNEEWLLRAKRSEKKHIFALTGETPPTPGSKASK